jgi:hypothetical protein
MVWRDTSLGHYEQAALWLPHRRIIATAVQPWRIG